MERRIATDALLFTIFATHHSVFAREPVKRGVARLVPDRLLRSSYVWIASLLLMSVCGLWQADRRRVYDVGGWRAAAHAAVQVAGLLLIASAVRKIDALELAGIREHTRDEPLQITGPYRLGAPSALSRLAARDVRRGAHDRRPAGLRRNLGALPGHRDADRGTRAAQELWRDATPVTSNASDGGSCLTSIETTLTHHVLMP